MRRIAALSVALFLLTACSPEAPGGGEAQPPADAPAAPAAPAEPSPPARPQPVAMSARGTEPFWRVDVTDKGFTLTRPDASAQTVAGLTVSTAGSVMTMTSAGPPAVQATFTKGDCSDGMSDLKYPYTVVLTWGAESLKGCGFNTAEEPHEGE